jgi:hypothetical protein
MSSTNPERSQLAASTYLHVNTKKAAAVFAALTILAGAPAIVYAAGNTPAAPIAIRQVEVQRDDTDDGGGLGAVTVAFENTTNVTATEVTFELDVDGTIVDQFTDDGTFAPGITIKHTFSTTADAADPQVKVVDVQFATP